MTFIKKEGILVNPDNKGWSQRKKLKQRILNQESKVRELEERLLKLENLVLNLN